MDLPLNPAYGLGVFRRRIRLTRLSEQAVYGELEDCNHGFIVTITHDGKKITAVDGEAKRAPFTTCPGALEPLQRLLGCNINATAQALLKHVEPRANCTHWLDLAVLAIVHSQHQAITRQYDVEVTDENADDLQFLRVSHNGQLIHDWISRHGEIVSPAVLSGVSLRKGFSSRVAEVFTDPVEFEAALVLQKGNFVANGRRIDLEATAFGSASDHSFMAGACFTYAAERVAGATRVQHTVRDFTATPELLLTFV